MEKSVKWYKIIRSTKFYKINNWNNKEIKRNLQLGIRHILMNIDEGST